MFVILVLDDTIVATCGLGRQEDKALEILRIDIELLQ